MLYITSNLCYWRNPKEEDDRLTLLLGAASLALVVTHFTLLCLQKLGSSGQRNASRCGLWWVEMLKARDQCRDAASVYFRISGEVIALFFHKKTDDDYIFWSENLYVLGAPTFGCNARASVLLLSVLNTAYVAKVWVSSHSIR